MANNLQIIRERLFKGYNDRLASEFLPAGYLADALNCFIRTGEIVKRMGYTIVGDDLGANACQGLKGVRFADGTQRIYAVFNGEVYSKTDATTSAWTALGGTLSTTANVEIVPANNAVYFFDGANTVVKVTSGNVLSTVAAIPIGTIGVWFHNAMHVTGVSGLPNRLRISNNGDPEDYSGGTQATLDVNPNDGDYITAMHPLNNELIIFKTQRAWSLSGFGTSALTLANLNERLSGFGTLAHRAVVNTGNDLLYLGFLGDKPVVRSLQKTRFGTIIDGGIISNDIESSLDGLNKAQLAKVAGIFDGRNAWFAVCHAAATTNNRVYMYDIISKGWVRHVGINASVFESFTISATPQLYFGEASADSKVYVFDTSTSDNGTAINFSITTRRYGGGVSEAKKKWKYLKVSAKEVGDYDITIDKAKDGFSYDNLGTLNLSGTGTVFNTAVFDISRFGSTDVKRATFNHAKDIGYYMQYQMYDTSATSQINIRNWEVLSIPRRIRE